MPHIGSIESGRVLAFPFNSYLKIEAAIFMIVTCISWMLKFKKSGKNPVDPSNPVESG